MASYGGVSFDVLKVDGFTRPEWLRQPRITVRPIPGANKDDLQSTGLGNWEITVEAESTQAGAIATLVGLQGVTKRTLTSLFGANHSNVMLTRVEGATYDVGTRATVRLTFVREG